MIHLFNYIVWDPNIIAFHIGHFGVRWYSICWLIGLVLAFFIVKSHMAHHQSMTLCAICNALTGNALVNLFHSDARMEAFSLLLEERI